MNSTHEESLFGFDLDFLQPTTNNIPVQALKQRYIGQIKRRIIRVDALNRHCKDLKLDLINKNKELDILKFKLDSTTQEYTQTSLEYKEALENYSKYEAECTNLKSANKNYQEKYLEAENRVLAGNSHIVQLQQLVKEYERKIDAMEKNEKKRNDKLMREKAERDLLMCKKKHEKEIAEWQFKYDTLQKKFEDMNGKLNNKILTKSVNDDNDSLYLGEHSENEDNISIGSLSPLTIQDSYQNNEETHHSRKSKHNICNDRCETIDSESKTESVSIDTGCGSSLASSDNEKWLNSPDFIFSPIQGERVENNHVRKLEEMASNLILIGKRIEAATSPLPSVKTVDVATSPLTTEELASNPMLIGKKMEAATSPLPSLKMFEAATSPIIMEEVASNHLIIGKKIEAATSPLPYLKMIHVATSPIIMEEVASNPIHTGKRIEAATSPLPTEKMYDIATSPIAMLPDICTNCKPLSKSVITKDISESPIILNITNMELPVPNNTKDLSVNSCIFNNITHVDLPVSNKNYNTESVCPIETLETSSHLDVPDLDSDVDVEDVFHINIQEKDCLELNSCKNVEPDRISDQEIEMILSTMRLDYSVLTPMPISPKKIARSPKSYNYETHSVCPVAAIARDQALAAKEEAATARKDLAKATEENKIIIANLANLMKDMSYVKTVLKSRFTVADKNLYENGNETNNNNDYHNFFNSVAHLQNSENEIDVGDRSPINSPEPLVMNISEEALNSDTIHSEYSESDVLLKPVQELQVEKCDIRTSQQCNTADAMPLNPISSEVEAKSPIKEVKNKAVKRVGKLTYLSKYRKKCEVRNHRIKRETPPLKKPRMKVKKLPSHGVKKVTSSDSSATLNDKQIYAKAVKVMAELKAKKDNDCKETVPNTTIQQEHIPITSPHNVLPGITSPNLVVAITPLSPKMMSSMMEVSSPISDITSPISPNISARSECTTRKITASIPSRRSIRFSKTSLQDEAATDLVNTSHECNTSPIRSHPLSPKTSVISPKRVARSSTPPISCPTTSITPSRRSARRLVLTASPKSETTCPQLDTTSPVPKTTTNPDVIVPNTCVTLSPTFVVPNSVRTTLKSSDMTINCTKSVSDVSDISTVLAKDLSKRGSTRKRGLSNSENSQCKRVLRSNSIQSLNSEEHTNVNDTVKKDSLVTSHENWHPKKSILCVMIQKYGKKKLRPTCRNVSDSVLNNITQKIDSFMSKIHEGQSNNDTHMNELVDELKTLSYKNLVSGIVRYLKMPERKMELFGKVQAPPAPQMTRSEAVLLYLIRHLRTHWSVDLVHTILSSLEHTLFKLNRTPDFDVIESVSHFYALVCRYFSLQSRLKTFMLDAMYCILFKSAPLIKQCLEVWPHIIPLAHMSAAKIPLVTTFIYLLHFYKCEDRFNRVQDIRFLLQKKYHYQLTEWNEKKILELVSNSISDLKDIPCEKKMLRLAIIILGKRHGPRWTQNNIIKKLFQFIEKDNVPDHIKAFCIAMIGPMMKPYPVDMKVHCEIAINQLMEVLRTTTSMKIEEAAISSMILLSRHNTQRVNEMLLSRKFGPMSLELEEIIRGYVRMKPLHVWLRTISRPCGQVENEI